MQSININFIKNANNLFYLKTGSREEVLIPDMTQDIAGKSFIWILYFITSRPISRIITGMRSVCPVWYNSITVYYYAAVKCKQTSFMNAVREWTNIWVIRLLTWVQYIILSSKILSYTFFFTCTVCSTQIDKPKVNVWTS